MIPIVESLKEKLTGQPTVPLRPNAVEEKREEMERLESFLKAPAWVPGNRGAANQRYRKVKEMLETQSAKPIADAKHKDDVHRLSQEVLDTVIRPALLPIEVMHRNPAGAVDEFRKREGSKDVKHAILTYKRAVYALNPDNTSEQSLASVEKFRPSITPPGTSSFMAPAQLPGVFAMSPQAKENWPADLPPQGTVNSPLFQVQERERLQNPALSAPEIKQMKMSEADRKAWGNKMVAARNAKKAARQARAQTLPSAPE